ncbi:ABC transporter permease [Micromonospora arborensis]|uniref:ABC transporter permease n=1 Tax=Micromonospora arborensis TaxID=2116518 RepID=UPI003720A3D3
MNAPSRLLPRDVVRVGAAGLRTRPLRVLLSAVGIAIGIAAMVCVVGVASSSRESLDRQLALLGTNLLTVGAGHSVGGESAHLPVDAVAMIGRIGPVISVTATATLAGAHVYRSDRVPPAETGNITTLATRNDLLDTVGATIADGTWLNVVTARYPAVVLGAGAAKRLGVTSVTPGVQVWLGGRWFTVIGVLNPVVLVPELDYAALVGWPVAASELNFDGYPTKIFARTRDEAVAAVRTILAATANPEHPNEVAVSRPSDALVAKDAADTTLSALLLGLGAVALLVGGVGVANTMVISVLERRPEIGLRRALGATRHHIRLQFLAESLLLSTLGGVGGVLLGILATAAYSNYQTWPVVVPAWATIGGVLATVLIGACAGVYPAWRAARISPTEALGAS